MLLPMLRAGQIIQLLVIAMLGVGLVMVQSAGMQVGRAGGDPASILHGRSILYAAFAVVAMLLAGQADVRWLFKARGFRNPLWWALGVSVVLLALTLVPGMGKSVNGASRWLYLGPRAWNMSFQPSEVMKWVLPLAVAWWCARRRGVMHRFGPGMLPPLVLIGLACGMIVIEDLGTAALIGLVAVGVLIAGGASLWKLAILMPVLLAAGAYFLVTSPYRMARLMAFRQPWDDPLGVGYHPIQSMLAIAQGGLTGRGLGNGIQKFGYLPEDTTDFIFAVICEETGIAGAALVIGLYLILLWVGLGVVRDCRDTFGRLVALGVLLTVGLQATINIAVVTVVVPPKGIALPLISSGGTGWVLTAAALGLVAALDRANGLEDRCELESGAQRSLSTAS